MILAPLSFLLSATVAYAYVASGYYRPLGYVGFYLQNALVSVGWQGAIDNARGAWNGAGASFTFYQYGTTNRSPSLVQSGTSDGYNDIGALSLGSSYVGYTVSTLSVGHQSLRLTLLITRINPTQQVQTPTSTMSRALRYTNSVTGYIWMRRNHGAVS